LPAETGRRWARVVAVSVIVLLGVSRVHLGVHLPGNVLVGWAAGTGLLVAFLRWRAPVTAWLAARSAAAQAGVALAVSLAFLAAGALVRTAFTGWDVPGRPRWAPGTRPSWPRRGSGRSSRRPRRCSGWRSGASSCVGTAATGCAAGGPRDVPALAA
jgi:hypothetical protein